MTITINENLDPKEIKKDFSPKGRVHIKNFFGDKIAERIYTCLATKTPWQFTYNDGNDVHYLTPNDLKKMIGRRHSELSTNIYNRAKDQFQFAQQDYPLTVSFEKQTHPDIYLYKVHEFLNSKAFLSFAEKVTGVKKISKAETQAVFFTREQFYCQNDGTNGNDNNKVGFHLGFSKEWRPDWGGYHNFFNEDGNIELGLMPDFNTLTLFKLPQIQSISHIPPYAGTPKFGIHGYLQAD
jgi:Rps23 Pro-64 3,4-dihydroxylase Tpa1-like proline 4-hydroxylase